MLLGDNVDCSKRIGYDAHCCWHSAFWCVEMSCCFSHSFVFYLVAHYNWPLPLLLSSWSSAWHLAWVNGILPKLLRYESIFSEWIFSGDQLQRLDQSQLTHTDLYLKHEFHITGLNINWDICTFVNSMAFYWLFFPKTVFDIWYEERKIWFVSRKRNNDKQPDDATLGIEINTCIRFPYFL